jgi:hypothetical protein
VKSTARTASGGLPDKARMRQWLSQLSWGLSADALHRHADQYPNAGNVPVLLPLWESLIVDGKPAEGRIRWTPVIAPHFGCPPSEDDGDDARTDCGDSGTVRLLAPSVWHEVSWEHADVAAPDHDVHVARLRVLDDRSGVEVSGQWPIDADAPVVAHDRSLMALHRLGLEAEWSMLAAMEPFVLTKLREADAESARELGVRRPVSLYEAGDQLLDGLALERLGTVMCFGSSGTDEKSSAAPVTKRSVRRLIRGRGQEMTVPVTTYLEKNVWQQAGTAVRRAIGDPDVGPVTPRSRVGRSRSSTSPRTRAGGSGWNVPSSRWRPRSVCKRGSTIPPPLVAPAPNATHWP